MLNDSNAIATVAVRDLEVAAQFYRDTLGLRQVDAEGDEAITLRTGNTTINVYRSQHAGSNKATAVTWPVGDDLEGVVNDLKSKGVVFEHYDMPNSTRKGDIHVFGDLKVAWFKDPDGNIHNVVNR
jgi:catechol 2,3-dioxygenase-like lactoylglutathione lyase family enzyme